MTICVYLHTTNNSIRYDGVQCEYYLLGADEYIASQSQSSGGTLSLPVDDPAVNELIGGIILLFVLAYVIRQVLNSIRGNNS